jgi:sec-independent protein translocase protein TatA
VTPAATQGPLLALPGLGESLIILVVLMLLFGAKKLPMLARGLGAGIRNFKGELKGPHDHDEQ